MQQAWPELQTAAKTPGTAAAEQTPRIQSRGTHASWTNTKSGLQVGYSNHTKFTGKSMTRGCTADTVIEERAQQ